jgi:hypothetical protein
MGPGCNSAGCVGCDGSVGGAVCLTAVSWWWQL